MSARRRLGLMVLGVFLCSTIARIWTQGTHSALDWANFLIWWTSVGLLIGLLLYDWVQRSR